MRKTAISRKSLQECLSLTYNGKMLGTGPNGVIPWGLIATCDFV